MSNLLKKISNSKIIFFLLAIIIILPLLPLMSVSAAVSGMMYYEHNFELPLYGSTGCLVKDVGSISAGTAFTILEEQGTNLKVKLQNGTETTVNKTFCIINLPDVVPSIKYDITNSYGSLFKIRGANIAGITGQSLYQYGTSKKSNPRLGKSEFLVPVLFDTAIKIAAAQKAALADDYTLVIYEAYRPTYAQNKIYTAYSPLVTADIRGDYPTSWFIAPGKSNHQEGYAVDLSLAKVNSISFITLSNPAYKIADLNVMNCSMITPIHDLTVDSAIYKYQSGMVIYDKTAWQSYTKTDAFAGNADCQRLQKYMTDTGLTPFAAEWWHFNDVDARNALGDMTSITGNWELTTNASILEASAVSISPTSESISTTGTLTILSHDEAGNHIPIAHNGLPIPTTDAYYVGDDGNEYPAYCVDPDLPGVAEKGGTYDVTMSNTTIDSKILGMVLAGYPYKSLSELGVSNDWEANLATKIAIKAYLKGWAMNDLTFTDDSGARALAAAKVIYAAGMAYTGTQAPAPTVTVTATGGNTMTEDGDNLVKEYTVTSNVTIKGYSVSFKGTAPTGAQIVDINGNPKTTFASGDKFKVIIPKSSITSSGSVTLDIKGEVENNVIMYGATTVPGTQNYVLTAAPFVFENTEATATYSTTPTETTETPTEPTTQPETTQPTTPEAPTTGSLKIGKINGMTGEPVPGTKFLIEQIDGTYTTTVTVGSDGYYTITDIPKGSYKITEVYVSEPLILDTAPKSVYIDPETATEDNPIVVEFVNNQMTCVHVYKYDSKTNEPLNGAQFKLSRKDETSAIYTGITGESQCSSDCGLCKTPCNADGMICFGPLSPGWYTVSEVNPAPGYIIDPATPANQTFEVTGKETQEIQLKFDNKRRPELKIIKKDPDGNHLANVEFEIWKSGTQEKFSAKTDSNGEINIAWDNTNYPLNEGSYSIKEINVPAGYVLSDEVKEVMLVGNTLSEVVFVDPKKPGLTITKTDNDGNPLDGVTFEIWKSGTETKHSATTVGGKIVLEWDNADFPLEAGTYSIREVAVPRGYLLDTTIKEALLENGKMVTVPFTNDKRPELEIVKTDSAGKPLSGAVFTIKRAGTTTEYELTTDSSGKIVIPYDSPLYPLEPDRYIVTEKNAPEHYLLSDNNSQEVILEPNTRKTVTFVDAEKPKLTIEKYDRRGDGNGNALPLSAVTFRIWKTDGSYDQTLTTGSDGKIRITDLLPGEYHIQETATKDGYVLNTEVRTVILKGDDDVTETFYNLKRPELLIVKLDSKTGKPLANAHFQISKSDEILFQDLVTDVNGQILIPYNDPSRLLEEGTYKVMEIAPPPGYDLVLPASQNVVLRNGERTRVEFSDIRKPTLIITKLNALTKKPVPNTLYNIKWEDSTGGVHDLGNWYTDKNGQIIFEFAEVGWYQITEIMPAPGMTKTKNPVTRIYLAPGTNAYSDNELRTADNSSGQNQNTAGPGVNTINNDTTSSSGSGITVIDPFDNIQTIDIPVYNIASDANISTDNQAFTYSEKIDAIPDVTISGVTPDASDPSVDVVFAYDSIDTTEPILSADEYINPDYSTIQTGGVGDVFTDVSGTSYNLVDNGGVAAFANDVGTIIDFPLNSIIIKKEDATNGNMLAGAVFEIYRMSDETSGQSGTLVARLVTGNSGMLAVIGLEAGTYLVKEVRAPENYTLNNQGTQTALLVPDNTSNIEFTFSNYPFGSILVDKTDAVTNKPLAGARFELTKADGSHVAYANTDNYGHAVFTNLEPGAYIVSEQEAPADYQIDSTPQTVSVPANGEMQTVYFKDQPFGSIVIVKKDAVLKTPISGVRFHVTDIHGANIGDITQGNGFAADGIYTTDGNGEIRIDHIPQGNYLVTEVYAPDPYIIDNTPKTVYAEWGKIKTVEFFNSRTGALVITKYNSVTKEPLADAVFKITDIQGAVVGTSDGLYRTDETGTIHVYGLVPGGYKVQEVQAPQGFVLDNTVQTVQILDEKMYYRAPLNIV